MCGTETLKDVNLVIVHTNIKVNDLGKSEKESALQEKVDALEKFVATLEERLKMCEQSKKNAKLVDYSLFDKLHSLVKTNTLNLHMF